MILHKEKTVAIVLPEKAGSCEQFAAEELAKYLQQSLKVKVEQNIKESKIQFVIGGPQRNETAKLVMNVEEFQELVKGPEGICICAKGDMVLIAGSEDGDGYNRGTLYAVYEFLERYVGCCFGAYSKPGVVAGEIIPQHDRLEIEDGTYMKRSADLPYRTAIVQYGFWVGNANHTLTLPFIDWLAKNRYNRILTWVGIYEQYKELGIIPELEKRGIRLTVGHHQAMNTWLPPYGNKYFKTAYVKEHPEFYRLEEDGTRFVPKDENDYTGQLILCNRNPEVVNAIAENIIQWADENPIVDTIAFWPHDMEANQCCCEECAKYSKTENYLYFENELAKRVTAVKPNVKIDVLVYVDLWDCPSNIDFCDGIVIDESTCHVTGTRTCGKPDGSCIIGTFFEENLLAYREKCKNVVLYEYYMGKYSNQHKNMPAADEMQSLFAHYKKVGISGSGTQIECFNLWNNLLNFYCFGRTAYDASFSLEQQIGALAKIFGKGADEMAEILRMYETVIDGQVPIDEVGNYFAKHIDSERVYALYDAALEKADSAVTRNNIRMMRIVFRYTMLSTEDETDDEGWFVKRFIDPTGELAYMSTVYDSYCETTGGYGVAIPSKNKSECVKEPNDKWYQFDV